MLVCNHLIKLLDLATSREGILKPITIVPYANPIGLQQIFLGSHLGRFSLSTGVNFNRDWMDVTNEVISSIKDQLIANDPIHNKAIIRQALLTAITATSFTQVEKNLKKELFKRAATSHIVLDLHCDTDAIMHTYTHDRLWPQMSDLAYSLESIVNLLSPKSSGNPFDEACSCPWADIQDAYPDYQIEMACQSVTVELRGEKDVSSDLLKHLFFPFSHSLYRSMII
jgi:predicted deacylase